MLAKETSKILNVVSDGFDTGDAAGLIAKKILGSLQNIASSVAEFRNLYGSGHGRRQSFQELPERHAKLAVGAAVTLVEYYWEIYEWRKRQGRLK